MNPSVSFSPSGRGLAVLVLAVANVAALFLPASADDKPALTADQVREMQTTFQSERETAVSSGAAGRFSPTLLQNAAQAAKQGADALAAGRLADAADAFREARTLLPTVPADFPQPVVRVFGRAALRHGAPVEDLSYTSDGSRLVTAQPATAPPRSGTPSPAASCTPCVT